jgi:hypothetical protein
MPLIEKTAPPSTMTPPMTPPRKERSVITNPPPLIRNNMKGHPVIQLNGINLLGAFHNADEEN